MTPLERLRQKVEGLQTSSRGHNDFNLAIWEVMALIDNALQQEKDELRNGRHDTLFD